MNEQLLAEVTVFVLAVFVGFEVISKVPTTLHTPLMSATNAIHGIVLVGALLVAGVAYPALGPVLSVIVVILASLNVFGGYVVTERMLQMFKPRATPAARSASAGDGKAAAGGTAGNEPAVRSAR
jgi:H+-translocating NAD(P) transhydrogenase subunit alpha